MALRIVASFVALAGLLLAGATAEAEVHLGRNVKIGGHDFSNQTYDRKWRLVVHLYDRTPRDGGCAWRADRSGGRVKVCHHKRK